MSSLNNHFYRFGDFMVDIDQRVLLRAGKPVPLTPKVFDTLLILVESKGRIVEKDELKRRLWPDTFVEEANITFNIQQLRKRLSDDARNPSYIGTVARRGYRFIPDVEVVAGPTTREDAHGEGVVSTVGGNGVAEPTRTEPIVFSPRNGQFPIAGSSPAGIAAGALPSKRLSNTFIVVGVVALIVLSSAAWIVWKFSNRSAGITREDKSVDNKSESASNLKLEQLTLTGQSYHLAISPDGKYVAYEREVEKKGGIWIRQLATNTNVELVVPSGRIYGLAFANNGEYLYFVKGDPTVMYRVPCSNQVQLTTGGPKNFQTISGDSKWVLYNTTDDWHLWKVSIDGGEPVELAGYVASLASISPDQKTIVCVQRIGSKRALLFLPFEGGQPSKRVDLPRGSLVGYRIKWTPDGKALIYMSERDGPISIVKQPVGGAPTEVIATFDQEELFDFDYSADGQFLAVTRGGWKHDVVLISDLNR